MSKRRSQNRPRVASRAHARRAPVIDAERRGELVRQVLPWVVAAAAALLFLPIVRYEFLRFDDPSLVYENPYFQPLTFRGLLELWRQPHHGLYIPATYTVWGIQTALFGMDGARFHVVNLLSHIANSVLVFVIARRVLSLREAPAGDLIAACGALLFAVHPLRVETVAWVSAMKDLLSTLFALLAVRAYLVRPPRAGAWAWVPRGTEWFVLSLLAKPSMVVLGPLVALIDVALLGVPWRSALRRTALWWLIAIPFGLVTMTQQPPEMLAELPPAWFRPFVALDALAFYVAKVVLPVGLAPVYGRTPSWLLDSGAWRWTWVVPALLLVAALWSARRGRLEPLGLLAAFAVALAPVIGLIPSLGYRLSVVADHYVYFPFLVVSLAVCVGLAALPDRARVAGIGIVLGACVAYALGSMSYLPRWRSDEAWYPPAIERAPRNALLRMTHGESLHLRGRYEEALAEFRETAELQPHADVYNNIGATLIALGRFEEARPVLEQALEMDPDDPEIQQNLSRLTRMIGR